MPNNPVVFTPQPIIPQPVIIIEPQKFVDDEDVIFINDQIKFKDRIADPNSTIKQGYKRVRQEDVLNSAYFIDNTTYEIIYEHHLNDELVYLPEGVVLEFNGGKLDNGILVGKNTVIDAPIDTIFGPGLTIKGNWNIDRAYSDWFSCYKNGYYIDPATFDETNNTYEYEGTTFPVGTPCGVTYNSDRDMLQQLLNLGAKHTIISEGIYMIDAKSGPGTALVSQLTWFQKKGLTLQIDGILKLIPNAYNNYSMFLIAECDHVTLCGSGKIVGDLPEHLTNVGEGGMCLQVNSTTNFKLEGLTFEQGWGDGVYYSWNGYDDQDLTVQTNHYWNDIRCMHNRRNGLKIENGNYIYISNSVFNNTGSLNSAYVSSRSGVEVAPLTTVNFPERFCKEIHFDNCEASYNEGSGFRFVRVLGGSVKDSEVCNNYTAFGLHNCYWSTENKDWGLTPIDEEDTDALTFVSNRIIIDGNTVKFNTGCFNSESSAGNPIEGAAGRPTSALIINNYIQECNAIISGGWQDTVVDNNNAFNVGSVFYLYDALSNFRFSNNHVFGINPPHPDVYESTFRVEDLGYGASTAVCRDVLVKNNTFKYSGGRKLHGGTNASKDEMTIGYPAVRPYLFQYIYSLITNPINRIIKFIDNHFDDELWALPMGGDNRIAWSSSQMIWQERTISEADIAYGYIKHFLPGDKIHVNGQTGFVRVGGWIDVVGTGLAANTSYQKNQIIYKSDRTAMFIASEDFTTTSSPIYPSPTDTTITTSTGTAPITHLDFSKPVVEWQNIGTFPGSYGGNIYLEELNNVGRRLIETATGDMYKWNGSAWVVV